MRPRERERVKLKITKLIASRFAHFSNVFEHSLVLVSWGNARQQLSDFRRVEFTGLGEILAVYANTSIVQFSLAISLQ